MSYTRAGPQLAIFPGSVKQGTHWQGLEKQLRMLFPGGMNEPDLQPILTGARVTLRPLRPDDWEALYAAASDPLIWEVHPVPDRYTEPVFREFFDAAIAGGAAFAIVDRQSGRIIGSSRYHGWRPETGEIEIGWTFIERAYWGGSVNAEIKRLMLDHAFTFAKCAIFVVGEDNVRSRKAMAKIGGRLRDGTELRTYQGKTHRYVIYEIRRSA